jgi:hypothetical protein
MTLKTPKKSIVVFCFLPVLLGMWFPQASYANPLPGARASGSDGDTLTIDAAVAALYESLTFPEGKTPDLERLASLFTPGASFTRVNKDGTADLMNTETFIRSFRERLDKGLIKSFHESEIARTSQVFGPMAHVFSTYQKGINVSDPLKMGRGINSLQMFNEAGRWRICAILWMDERPDCPIPPEFLPAGR